MHALVPLLLFGGTLSFGLGITLPLIRIDRLYFLTDEPSLIGIVSGLWDGGDWPLALLVGAFSLVLPAAKLALLHFAAYSDDGAGWVLPSHIHRWLHALANWSMLDVVLVALVIFAAKTSGLATAFTQAGLWFFAASVAMTAAASTMLKREKAG